MLDLSRPDRRTQQFSYPFQFLHPIKPSTFIPLSFHNHRPQPPSSPLMQPFSSIQVFSQSPSKKRTGPDTKRTRVVVFNNSPRCSKYDGFCLRDITFVGISVGFMKTFLGYCNS